MNKNVLSLLALLITSTLQVHVAAASAGIRVKKLVEEEYESKDAGYDPEFDSPHFRIQATDSWIISSYFQITLLLFF